MVYRTFEESKPIDGFNTVTNVNLRELFGETINFAAFFGFKIA
ncbi:hypothetical protein LX87_04307 [Larkinella arboricola]|uniref:Uncharacterized protein n=1 Tax=Larkinella arboricola TaxID=643671 RepID=A0A327WR79_LARAB|nr:hypothetical protein LX87_04307 [Larkinella arboricola]